MITFNRMQEGNTAVALAMVTPGYDQDPASGVADYTTHQDQAQFEADKRAVYKHPLFPLLALLFERCEQATQSSDNSTSESFNMDIQAFVQHQERDRKPFLINDPEIDGLVRLKMFFFYYSLLLKRELFEIAIETNRKQMRQEKKDDRLKVNETLAFLFLTDVADDQGDTGVAHSSPGVREGARAVQRLLQQVHYVFEGQDAERKLATQRLQPPWARYGSVEWKQWQQSVAG